MRFMDVISDFISFLAGIILSIGSVLGLIFLLGNVYGSYQCDNYQTITGKQTKYAAFDTCYVDTGKGFQRWDEYKVRSMGKDGLNRE